MSRQQRPAQVPSCFQGVESWVGAVRIRSFGFGLPEIPENRAIVDRHTPGIVSAPASPSPHNTASAWEGENGPTLDLVREMDTSPRQKVREMDTSPLQKVAPAFPSPRGLPVTRGLPA